MTVEFDCQQCGHEWAEKERIDTHQVIYVCTVCGNDHIREEGEAL